MTAGLMVADQYEQEHDNHCNGDQAHADHRGTGQADQVQPGCASFCALFSQCLLLTLGLVQLRPRSRRRW